MALGRAGDYGSDGGVEDRPLWRRSSATRRRLQCCRPPTAMAAVASSNTARTAITNSATAKNALASKPPETTVTKGNGNKVGENCTIRNGMGWLINCYNANSGGEAGSTWYKLDGVQTSQPAGTTNVGKFFTSSLAIYWWSSPPA